MVDSMGIPLSEASQHVGKAKQTIIKAIRSGRISGEKDENGEWRVEPVELFRVWPVVNRLTGNTRVEVDAGTQQSSHSVDGEIVAILREQIADLKDERDHWRSMAEKLLLTDQSVKAQPNFWFRLFGVSRT